MTDQSLPLYLQVVRKIKARIADGELRPGEQLMPLAMLAKECGVGMATVRRAVEVLEEEHLVHAHQGKGVYVCTYNGSRYWNRFHRFQRLDGTLISRFDDRLLCFEFISADEMLSRELDVDLGTMLIHWKRIMSFDGQINGYDEAYLPRVYFPRLSPEHFLKRRKDQSIYALYEDADDVVIANSADKISARLLESHHAKELGLPEGIPMFCVKRISWDIRRRKVEYRIQYTDARAIQIAIGE